MVALTENYYASHEKHDTKHMFLGNQLKSSILVDYRLPYCSPLQPLNKCTLTCLNTIQPKIWYEMSAKRFSKASISMPFSFRSIYNVFDETPMVVMFCSSHGNISNICSVPSNTAFLRRLHPIGASSPPSIPPPSISSFLSRVAPAIDEVRARGGAWPTRQGASSEHIQSAH